MRPAHPGSLLATILLACGSASTGEATGPPPPEGEMVYNTSCAMCHGRKGDLGMSRAKNLVVSTLTHDSVHPTAEGNRRLNELYASALRRC